VGLVGLLDRSTFVGALDQTGRDRAVAAILDRRARAVREHRKDLFLADVDRTNTALMAAQGSLYDHLTVIPFGELKFVVHPDLTYDLAEPPLKTRFRLRLYSPAVTMSYKIDGVDDRPVAVPWLPVFGLEKGRWILTDDDTRSVASTRDFAGQAWDAAGPIEVHRGPRITVVVSAEDHARAGRLVQMSEAALDEVLKVRPDKWPGRVFITAVRDPKVLGAYFSANGGKGDDNVAAIATAVYDEVLTWRGGGKKPGYASERVIFNPRSLDDREDQLSEILRHEFTHVAMGPVESDGVPRWLVEGYAEWVGMIDLRTGLWSSRLFDGGRKIPADLPADKDFYADNGQNYVYSWSACRYIADKWGGSQLIALYERYGKGAVADREAALLAVLGVSQPEFVAGWRQYVRQMVA